MEASRLPVAVRAWTAPEDAASRPPSRDTLARSPRVVLVFDTETTTDASQRLLFGAWSAFAVEDYRDELEGVPDWGDYVRIGQGLFHADDLEEVDPTGLTTLREYAEAHRIELRAASEWNREVFHRLAFTSQALVVGFNLPFDISRIAEWVTSSSRRPRGFSFVLSSYDAEGDRRENRYRPRVTVEALDSKRAFIEFSSARDTVEVDLQPDETGDDPDARRTYRGRFLDLRTMCFALTSQSHSLASACEAFEVVHAKERVDEHGVITLAYIDYCRRDVLATWELYTKVREEYERHPITLPPTKAWSSASIGKAYLEAMGVKPVLERQPRFSPETLGKAMVAYYGGRAECRIRRAPVPVVYLDFLSMYPTVNTLMGNWRLLTAREIREEPALDFATELLDRVGLDDVFEPETWPDLACLVLIEPNDDVLPVRAKYDLTGEWQIGLNPLRSQRPLWYTLADAIASKLLTGKAPRVVDAVRFIPSKARQRGLRPIALRGTVEVDPRKDDFFQRVIELRRGAEVQGLPETERKRLSDFLKVLANSASYGIFAEMNREESSKPVQVDRFGLDRQRVEVIAPEHPGRWCFPPLAALIAGGARLMLALLECCVRDLGGAYAFCDTDSMAIVGSEAGGSIEIGGAGGRALSWAEVDAIVERFERLKPFDRNQVTATLLKVEDENFDEPESSERRRRQLYCHAISAKRYCLYNVGADGEFVIRKWSDSGLGHLLDPLEPEREPDATDPDAPAPSSSAAGREWIRLFWSDTLSEVHGGSLPGRPWLTRPALSQFTVSTPHLLADFYETNRGKSYPAQVKPFNFMLIARDASIAADRKVMVAPYERDPRLWLRQRWRNRSDGLVYPVSIRQSAGGMESVRVVTYDHQLSLHRVHLEAKSLAPDGGPCGPRTGGELLRRPVEALAIEHIGKEANRIDEVSAGLIWRSEDVYTVFEESWNLARRVLAEVSIEQAMRFTERGRSATMELRAGRTRSSRRHRAEMVRSIADWCRAVLHQQSGSLPLTDYEAIEAWLRA